MNKMTVLLLVELHISNLFMGKYTAITRSKLNATTNLFDNNIKKLFNNPLKAFFM